MVVFHRPFSRLWYNQTSTHKEHSSKCVITLNIFQLQKLWKGGEVGMTESEKVINNLEYQIHLLHDIIPHVSCDDGEYLEAAAKTMYDALILLKAHEPIAPVKVNGT